MGNTLGHKKTTKVMKVNGETLKLKTPVTAEEVLRDYPGHVLLESEAVKHYGTRAKPLQAHTNLEPKRLYFVVELPKQPECPPRRVRSGIQMTAKEKLERLMLARRSASDLSILKQSVGYDGEAGRQENNGGPGMRVKLRLPRAEIERMMRESQSEAETAEKVLRMFMARGSDAVPAAGTASQAGGNSNERNSRPEIRAKRVSFKVANETMSEIAVAS